jgi:hypothetical protein
MDGLSLDKTDAMDDIAESRVDIALVSLSSEGELAEAVGCCMLEESVTSSVMTGVDNADWLPRTCD